MPKTFKDKEGREWAPDINAWTLMKFGEESGATIRDIMGMTIKIKDMMKFLWIVCEDQATERKLSEKDFMKSLKPDSLVQVIVLVLGELESTLPGIDLDATSILAGIPGASDILKKAEAINETLPPVTNED